jgi:hypothetical protein
MSAALWIVLDNLSRSELDLVEMRRQAIAVEVVDEVQGRVVITTYSDGKVIRTPVDPTKKATRKPRLKVQRAHIKDFTRKKQF